MDDDTRAALDALSAEITATQSLMFGIAMALRQRGLGQDILEDAFDFADDLAIAGTGHLQLSGAATRSSEVLRILEDLRAIYLGP